MRRALNTWHGPNERGGYLKAIHAMGRALGMQDDDRRFLQEKLTGVSSAKDMSLAQLSRVYQQLSSLAKDAGLAKPKRRRPGRDERLPDEVVTKEQLEAIGLLFSEIGVHPSAMMMSLCRRACGKPWAQTRADGNRIIEMLKSMQKRNWRPTKEQLT